ncbi:hypothetical protein C7437_1011268 [Psychrobacillus insolitus]|uniref:Lipoprotein n=1 Tax=Psychrobacillus insolitus TaxID=1461 RepID=A0A2W7MMP4_9BACI|nr:hypothetical protein [Psychrobacillus insolitus]PZX08145.1 hypothetical protein C7437_1011268 [Psychrobacillus insolitus]
MKKITSLLFILLLTGILAACGTTAEDVAIEEENITEDTTVEEKVVEENLLPAEADTSVEEVPKETESKEESTNIDDKSTSSSPEELEGTVVQSDNQNFAITVVAGFELTGEEPNKDLLFNKENDAQSMRIETFKEAGVNITDVTNNLVETLKASNEQAEVIQITDENQLPFNEFIEEANGFQIDTPDGKVSGYTFIKDGMVVKLTVFDTVDAPALELFVEMAETISSK